MQFTFGKVVRNLGFPIVLLPFGTSLEELRKEYGKEISDNSSNNSNMLHEYEFVSNSINIFVSMTDELGVSEITVTPPSNSMLSKKQLLEFMEFYSDGKDFKTVQKGYWGGTYVRSDGEVELFYSHMTHALHAKNKEARYGKNAKPFNAAGGQDDWIESGLLFQYHMNYFSNRDNALGKYVSQSSNRVVSDDKRHFIMNRTESYFLGKGGVVEPLNKKPSKEKDGISALEHFFIHDGWVTIKEHIFHPEVKVGRIQLTGEELSLEISFESDHFKSQFGDNLTLVFPDITDLDNMMDESNSSKDISLNSLEGSLFHLANKYGKNLGRGKLKTFERRGGTYSSPNLNAYSESEKKNFVNYHLNRFDRSLFDYKLVKDVANYQENRGPFFIMIAHIDNFHGIKKKYGDKSGAMVLGVIRRLIRMHIRGSDTACQYNEDTFAIILDGVYEQVAEKVSKRIAKTIMKTLHAYPVELYIGVSGPDEKQKILTPGGLIDNVQKRLYKY